jgi:hypothetical protein
VYAVPFTDQVYVSHALEVVVLFVSGFTVIVIVAVEAHCPAVGVNVYVVVVVLSSDGDHVPVMLLFEVVGRAVKLAPEQIAATCVNVGVTIGLTTIVMPFDVAWDTIKHGVAFDVITQVITSPLTNEVVV